MQLSEKRQYALFNPEVSKVLEQNDQTTTLLIFKYRAKFRFPQTVTIPTHLDLLQKKNLQ